jgi:hypothetical protein
MRIFKPTIFLYTALFLLSACQHITVGQNSKIVTEKQIEYRNANEPIHLTLGEKFVRGDQLTIMKGVLIAFGDLNMSVLNVDQVLGFMSASGRGVLPGNLEREITRTGEETHNEIRSPGKTAVNPGNYLILANVSIYDYDKINDQSKVKIRLSRQIDTLRTKPESRNHELFPPLLEAHYSYIWEKIGKHVFIENETK